jgi:hypothetical protein
MVAPRSDGGIRRNLVIKRLGDLRDVDYGPKPIVALEYQIAIVRPNALSQAFKNPVQIAAGA